MATATRIITGSQAWTRIETESHVFFIHDTGFDHNQSTHKRICHNTKSASVGIPEETDIHSSFEQMPQILAR